MPPALRDVLTVENQYIFRITHRDNLAFIIRNGVHCRASDRADPHFVEIGHPEIISKRILRAVEVEPGGVLSDYVSFYFTPCSPMLYNIVTGWKGLRQRAQPEIVILVSSLTRLDQIGCRFVIADRNATLAHADIKSGLELLPNLPWSAWRERDFRHDPDRPDKVERYQAEALVHRVLPLAGLLAIITHDSGTKEMIEQTVATAGLSIPVQSRSHWYP